MKVVQKPMDQEERETRKTSDGRSANTSVFAHLPTLRREVLVRAAVRRSNTLGGRMGQKQTLAPMIVSGSCDRQVWRIIKMKPPTDQTAKSETEGLLYSSKTLALDGRGKGKLRLVLRQGGPRRRFLQTVILRGAVSDSTAQHTLGTY